MRYSATLFFVTSVCLLPALPAAGQQPYTFTKILDLTTRPDNKEPFAISTATTPAFDGQWVVIRDNGSRDDGSLQAIWSFNTKDRTFHKLVHLQTVQPGGTATFSDLHLLDAAPAVRNGMVVFLARTVFGGSTLLEGIYSVPVAGGEITPVADYRTADPSGGTFSLFDSSEQQIGGFGFDGITAAFQGQGSTQAVGIYAASATGSFLSLIADSLHPFAASGTSVNGFTAPVVSGANVVMAGTDGSSYSGLYLGKAGNNGAVTELVNSKQQLPGGKNPAFRTQFDAPYLALDGTLLAFHASDAAAPAASPFSGLYWTDLTSPAINTIADVSSTLPGLGKLRSVGGQGVAVSQGNVLFKAADTTAGYPGKNALYLWAKGGKPTRIVGTGDVLDGSVVQVVHDPGPGALSGAGFVFLVEFGSSKSFAVYYATPGADTGAGNVASFNAASYASNGPLAAGSIASVFGQGLADSAVAAGAPPLSTTLANVTLSVKDSAGTTLAAALYFAAPTQINYVIPDGTAPGTATVTVAKNAQAVATGTIQIAAVAPGLFTANGDGKGVAAAIALKTTAAGTQTWQYAAACGTTPGSCATAPIDLGAATDQVFLELFGTGIRGYKTSITATIGGTAVTPEFAVQSQYPGMDQVNVSIDRSLTGRGEVDVVLMVDGVAANTVKINVK